jgi:1-acyl-sn-glycerol-3-phosphate acyltransferase
MDEQSTLRLSAVPSTRNPMSPLADWAIIDVALAALTAFHVCCVLVMLVPSDASYKQAATKVHYRLVKRLHSTPLLVSGLLYTLAALSLYLCGVAFSSGEWSRALTCCTALTCGLALSKASDLLIKMAPARVVEIEQELERSAIAEFKPPSQRTLEPLMAPMELLLRPDVSGLDNVKKDQPHLFVMNHSLWGVEMSTWLNTIYQSTGVFPRGLADHFHFGLPHGALLRTLGAVDGTRDNVDALMAAGHDVLVYPGGGHEVFKHSSVSKYSLLWKDRLGFARMAIKHGYPILPTCAVGTEDMLDIVADLPVGFVRKGLSVPIIGPIWPSRLQRVYIWFGEPIPTAQYNGDFENDEFAREVRDKARAAVLGGIHMLQGRQAEDPDRFLLAHLGNRARGAWQAAWNALWRLLSGIKIKVA